MQLEGRKISSMDNIAPASIDARDLPQGFQKQDPNQQSNSEAAAAAAKKEQIEEQRQSILQQALTPDALERLRRIKLVKEQKALALEKSIVAMAISGKLPGPINEGKLIEMLERGNMKETQGATSISIQRKKYAFDSDDEEEVDDDDV